MALKNTTTFDVMRFWGVGSIDGRSLDILPIALPLIGAGLVLGPHTIPHTKEQHP